MPSRNVLKVDMPETYYHVYARGGSKQVIFTDEADYAFFISLFERYLGMTERRNSAGVVYEKLYGEVELVAYCLMPNHFHALLFQKNAGGMARLMRGVLTSYSRYFNHKHGRSGQLFESRYKAAHISTQSYLEHVSRYIHLNPWNWRLYAHSSIEAYLTDAPDWLHPEHILQHFETPNDYRIFVADREAAQKELDGLKKYLADT
jgi:putative transposase